MNPITLQRLIDKCVKTSQEHSEALDKLGSFCKKTWGFDPHDIGDMCDERITGSINYGEYTIQSEEFRNIMDKAKQEKNHD